MPTPDFTELAKLLLLLLVVSGCTATDISARRIPNAYLLPALLGSVLLGAIGGGLAGVGDCMAGLAVGIGMLLPFYLLGGMSAGDVKLLGVVGSLLGGWGAAVAGMATLFAGGLLGALFILWRVLEPALSSQLERLVQILGYHRNRIIHFRAPTTIRGLDIPYAPAIAVGSLMSIWYLDLLAL